jgi:hypothetical protein
MKIPPQYASLSPAEVAKLIGVSREGVGQARRRAAGLCRYCKAKPLSGLTVCAAHRTRITNSHRKINGFKPWTPGGRGRPPINQIPEGVLQMSDNALELQQPA